MSDIANIDFVAANSAIYLGAPSAQEAVNTVEGWVCAFPPSTGVHAGGVELYGDVRVTWALDKLGGAEGRTVLELGPLEASHTYMLENAGAREITAIEANRLCYLKCLIAKEIYGLRRSSFMLGNFMTWMQDSKQSFDIIWATGVLYHLTDPVEAIHLIGERTSRVHIWTHYVPDDESNIKGAWSKSLVEEQTREVRGQKIVHHLNAYGDVVKNKTYCGGVYDHTTWLKRKDIISELHRAGFDKIEIAFETLEHLHGPSFAIAAYKS